MLPYSLKFIWSPYIDKLKSYGIEFYFMMACCMLMIGILFSALGLSDTHSAASLVGLSICIAFMSSTLDDIIDGFRSHVFKNNKQSFMISLNVISYRIGMLMGAVIIWSATTFSWQVTLQVLGPCFVTLSLLTTSLLPKKTTEIKSRRIDWLAPIKRLTKSSIMPVVSLVTYRCADLWIYGLLTVYLVQYLQWSAIEVANTLQFIGVISVVSGNLIAHMVIKKLSLQKAKFIFLICQFATIVLLATTMIITHKAWVVFCIIGQEFVYGFTSLTVSMICYENIDKNYPTYSFATFTSIVTLPRFIMSPLSAYIVANQLWTSYFSIALCMSAVAFGVIRFTALTEPRVPRGPRSVIATIKK